MTIEENASPSAGPAEVAGPVAAVNRAAPRDAAALPPRSSTANSGPRLPDRVDASSAALFEAAQAIPRALQVAGSIFAPTTLLTALFFYFGLLYAIAYYRFFGVNYTVLAVPTQSYLILSVSAAILPLALVAVAALVLVELYQLPLETLSGMRRLVVYRVVCPLVSGVGLLLVGAAAVDVLFRVALYPSALLEARGLSLSVGLVFLAYAGHLRRILSSRRRTPTTRQVSVALTVTKWGGFCLLVGVGLFWAVGSYAIRMGSEGARGFAAAMRCAPEVVLYSEKPLNLGSSGLRQEGPIGTDSAYGFRYPGLKLVPQAGDNYLLLPADWRPGGRPAIVLARSDPLRLEFVVAAPPPPGC